MGTRQSQLLRHAIALAMGGLVLHAACMSSPRTNGPAPSAAVTSVESRSPADETARAPDNLEQLRSECRVLSEVCVQMAVPLLKTHQAIVLRIFSDACDADIARGCAELGRAYSEGDVLPPDGKQADDAFEKACHLDPQWCD